MGREGRRTVGKRLTGHDKLSPKAHGRLEVGVGMALPKSVRNDVEAMRWLYHWVGDALADRGHLDPLVCDVESGFDTLTTDIVCAYVKDLLREATASARPSKKPAAKRPRRAPTSGRHSRPRRP